MGQRLAIPFGDRVKFIIPTTRSQSIMFSLRTDDPVKVKILQATIAGHLEALWQAFRNDAPVRLSHRQAIALAGDLYRIWADSEHRARTISVEHIPGVGWKRSSETQEELEAHYWNDGQHNAMISWSEDELQKANRVFLTSIMFCRKIS